MLVGCTNSAERDEPDETSPSNGRCSPNGCSSGVAATLRPRWPRAWRPAWIEQRR